MGTLENPSSELNPRIQYVLDHDLSRDRQINTRKVLEVLGGNLHTPMTRTQVADTTGLNRNLVLQSLTRLIRLIEGHHETYGFQVKVGKSGVNPSPSELTYLLVIQEGQWSPQKKMRHVHKEGEPTTLITDQMRERMASTLQEIGVNVPLLENPPLDAEALIDSATWALPNEHELDMVRALMHAAVQGVARRRYDLEHQFDIPREKGHVLDKVHSKSRDHALRLGFVSASMGGGYNGMFFLDPEERRHAIMEHDPDSAVYLEPIVPFDHTALSRHIELSGLPDSDPTLHQLFMTISEAQLEGEPLTRREAAQLIGRNVTTVSRKLATSQKNQALYGAYLRMRLDNRIECALTLGKYDHELSEIGELFHPGQRGGQFRLTDFTELDYRDPPLSRHVIQHMRSRYISTPNAVIVAMKQGAGEGYFILSRSFIQEVLG